MDFAERRGDAMKAKLIGLVAALVLIVSGALLTFRGLGWLGGSAVSEDSTLATLGSIIAGLGVALGYVSLRRRLRGT